MNTLSIRIILALAVLLVVGGLGGTVYVQRLSAKNVALQTENLRLETNLQVAEKVIETNRRIADNDNARAEKAEASLKTFQEKADAEIARASSRLCLDRDDTRRLQRILGTPVR